MIQNPDEPLTPVELFRRGIEITQEIRGRIIEARAYYLGRSSREPAQPLSVYRLGLTLTSHIPFLRCMHHKL